ncbi:glycosyltransferase family 2 protein [Pseudonocardia zijingensis]|jgi:hypothetical protein
MTNVSGGGYGQQRPERREHAADAVGGRRAMQRNGNPRVSVVVPTRNEARNLEVVLPAIAAVRPAVHEIIIVDGNSVDGTIETAQRVLPWVKVITQTRKGKGNAMACGFAAATGDVIVMFDADGSADPAEIPAFVRALIDGADFAKGSRFVRGGGSDDITLLRKSGNAGLNGVANALFGTSYTDLCYGYNAFWADILPVLDLPPIDTAQPADGSMLWGDGFEIETVLNCRVAAAGLKITEVPSMERERIFGQTNLRTFADGTRVLRTLAAERRRASRRSAERVQVEEQSRALTPAGGIPVVPPTPQAPSPAPSVNVSVNSPVNGPAPSKPVPSKPAHGTPVPGKPTNGAVPAADVPGPSEPGDRRAAAPPRAEGQPRVEAPVREKRDGVSLRLALEEEAS